MIAAHVVGDGTFVGGGNAACDFAAAGWEILPATTFKSDADYWHHFACCACDEALGCFLEIRRFEFCLVNWNACLLAEFCDRRFCDAAQDAGFGVGAD